MLQTLQILQGHIPMLIHSSPGQVLQIGFGTGQTTHSAFLHPLKSYRVVEISRDVLDLASLHFKDLHGEVMDDPRFRVSVLDGRNYIKYSREPLDIIMNDANYAVATGSASLFTRSISSMPE